MSKLESRLLDLTALVLATLGTFGVYELERHQAVTEAADFRADASGPASELDGLMTAESAKQVGSYWLDEPSMTALLTFDPTHDRLVWQISGSEGRVLLDAETGEALEFQWV